MGGLCSMALATRVYLLRTPFRVSLRGFLHYHYYASIMIGSEMLRLLLAASHMTSHVFGTDGILKL